MTARINQRVMKLADEMEVFTLRKFVNELGKLPIKRAKLEIRYRESKTWPSMSSIRRALYYAGYIKGESGLYRKKVD